MYTDSKSTCNIKRITEDLFIYFGGGGCGSEERG